MFFLEAAENLLFSVVGVVFCFAGGGCRDLGGGDDAREWIPDQQHSGQGMTFISATALHENA